MLSIREATRSDNEGLLLLTLLTPMNGEISIRTDRYPDFFRSLDWRGPSLVLVAEAAGAIVGCVSATRLEVYVEGKPEDVYYLGDLKAHPRFQRTGLAVRLLKAMRHRLTAYGADLVVCAAAFGNDNILPFFEGRAGLPRAHGLGTFRVYQILPSRRSKKPATLSIQEESEQPDLLRLYNEHFRRYQFGPVLRPGSLREARHWVARSGSEIRAALSVVDVGQARQNVLVRLPWSLGALASTLRFARRYLPLAELPQMNRPIRTLHIKALASRNGGDEAIPLLIGKARNIAFKEGYHFLSIGIHDQDPLKRRLRTFPKFSFKSLGFMVGLKREDAELRRLKQRIPYEDYSLI